MDFQTLKRRDLQSLCKLNNIPANTTNAAMADALASLPTVEGLEEFMASEAQGSPERSVTASSIVPGTTATRTRCRTRTRAVEGTDTKKTPATRTARKRATQGASVQKKTEKDLQAEFEADMEKSEVTENNVLPGGELNEILEEVSGLGVDNGQSSEIQSEPQTEVQQQDKIDGEKVIDFDDNLVNEAQDEASEMLDCSEKIDFHSLSRKDLQNLCKKNKIPANMTNAAMADSLRSLGTVEGLQEFLKECESQVPGSPPLLGIISSCARRSQTTMKVTREEPRSSKLITKSCRSSRRRIVEETEVGSNDVSETPAAPSVQHKAIETEKESIQEKEDSAVHKSEESEVSGVAEFIGDISNSLTPEAPVNAFTFDDFSNVESLKEPEEMVSMIDENPEVIVLTNSAEKVDLGPNAVATYATQDEDLKFGSADRELETIEVQKSSNLETDAESETQDGWLENQITAIDSPADSCLIEKHDNVHAEDQKSIEFVSESTSQADLISNLVINEGCESGNSKLEKEVTFSSDSSELTSPFEFEEGTHAEDDISEKSDSESVTKADELSLEINVESEGSCSENEISDLSDSEPEDEISDMSDSAPTYDHLSLLTDLLNNQFDTESTIEVQSCLPTESKTHLYGRSLRKLKRMYKERLQAETMAKQTGKLSLGKTEIPLVIVEENLQQGNGEASVSEVMPGYNEAKEDGVEESEEHADNENQSDNDKVEQENALQETLVTNYDVEKTKLHPVGILLDNEVIPEDALLGEINVITCPPQATPSKSPSMTKMPLLSTPTKSSCKTPKSTGRQNCDLDVNKENINKSVSKTEPGKIKVAVTGSGKIMSAMSMGKLKKELQVLQSDKKKRALKIRSENLLSSP